MKTYENFNIEFLNFLLEADPEGFANVIEMTISDIENRRNLIEESYRAGIVDDVVDSAHAVKSVCGQIGAEKLHQISRDIELNTSTETLKHTKDYLKQFDDEYKNVKEILLRFKKEHT